jgi:hypothetical protein
VTIDLTESEYRTLLEALGWAADDTRITSHTKRRFNNLRDNLRVRWERAADEQQRKELAK